MSSAPSYDFLNTNFHQTYTMNKRNTEQKSKNNNETKALQEKPTMDHIYDKKSWLGGPTHTLQPQHIPGYKGHVPLLKSENLFGKPFSKITAKCLEDSLENKGFIINEKDRFHTINRLDFKEPDLRKFHPEKKADLVYNQFKKTEKLEEDIKNKYFNSQITNIEEIPPIDRVPIIGYQGFKPVYKKPLKEIKPVPFVENQKHFNTITEGFQKGLLEHHDIQKKIEERTQPIVGYTGHVSGLKAENKYGVNFKDTIASCINEKRQNF